ncbi:hypothetical protein [Polaribacter sp. Hel_I_88]|uniref:hypothetical protein n=1 Tax=Polaribacter sp. Hel_I_88 TaxID=1250006 RepID=UPI000478A9BE|nr:hypothetical protein [Polaribacter sp. Hel_I_88]
MKHIKLIVLFIIALFVLNANAQQKKIKFNKGTLKICSSKSFIIEGYDGDEVIIESLHQFREMKFTTLIKGKAGKKSSTLITKDDKVFSFNGVAKNSKVKSRMDSLSTNRISYTVSGAYSENDSTIRPKTVFFKTINPKLKAGLKKLGKKNENVELGIFFIIEQKNGELIFKDDKQNDFIMTSNREQYKIKIPNSIKLNWITDSCEDKKNEDQHHFFFNSEISRLYDFDGEVSISTSIHNVNLKDVTGPVSINSIGGNVSIEFENKIPKQLYSVYSNNGYINVTIPKDSDLNLDITASEIFSDIEFKVEEDNVVNDLQNMKLKLNKGIVKMKLNANLGNIYLRKK